MTVHKLDKTRAAIALHGVRAAVLKRLIFSLRATLEGPQKSIILFASVINFAPSLCRYSRHLQSVFAGSVLSTTILQGALNYTSTLNFLARSQSSPHYLLQAQLSSFLFLTEFHKSPTPRN
jgi:hypothetical protein